MGINLGSNFDLQTSLPLDSRLKVADLTERDAINSSVRYEGMIVYVVSEATNFQLIGGISNASWTKLAGAGGGQGELNYSANPLFAEDLTGVETSDEFKISYYRTTDEDEILFSSLSEGSLKVFKAALDASGAYATLGSITPDKSYRKLSDGAVKLFLDTTQDTNFAHESFEISAYDQSGNLLGSPVKVEANTAKEYQLRINPFGATSIKTRMTCVSSNTVGYSFVVGYHVIGKMGQVVLDGVTKWENVTMTCTFTNATVTAKRRYVGKNAEYMGTMVMTGSTAAATLDFTLPSGDVIDTSELGAIEQFQTLVQNSITRILDSGTANYPTGTLAYNTTTTLRADYMNAGGTRNFVNQASPMTWGTGDKLWFSFSVPLTRLPVQNTLTNFELGLQTVYAKAWPSSTDTIGNNASEQVIFNSKFDPFGALDSDGAYYTQRANEKVTVDFRTVFSSASWTAANYIYAEVYVNNVLTELLDYKQVERTATQNQTLGGSVTTQPITSKNTKVDVRVYQNSGSNRTLAAGPVSTRVTYKAEPDFTMYNAIPTLETIKDSSGGAVTYTITSGQYGDLTSFSIPKGQEWDIHIQARVQSNNASSFNFGLGTVSGNNAFNTTEGEGWLAADKLATIGRVGISLVYNHQRASSDTTYYLKSFMSLASTTNIAWQLFARRVL